MIPEKAFILAAGLGTRMRPLTDRMPKPLAVVGGRTLLERTIDGLARIGVNEIVINVHHLSGQIVEHLQGRTSPRIHISHEDVLLETGGGIKKALTYFGQEPFFALSGDGLWLDGPGGKALERLARAWDGDKMDILLLVQPVSSFKLTEAVGDLDLLPDGRVKRSLDRTGAYMFTSIRINHPRIFDNSPAGAFSYLELMDRAEKQGRIYGLIHDGEWHHLSTMADLDAVDKALKK